MPETSPDLAFQTALQHHRMGRLAEAEAIYRQILSLNPDHADALHFLGVIALQAGRWEPAIDLFRRSIAVKPSHGGYHVHLGEALRMAGRIAEAAEAFSR